VCIRDCMQMTMLIASKQTCGDCMRGREQSEIQWVMGRCSCYLLCSQGTWHERNAPRHGSRSRPNVTARQSSTSVSSCCPSCPCHKVHTVFFTVLSSPSTTDTGQPQFVQLQLKYNYPVFGQLQLQLHVYKSGILTTTITYQYC